MVIDKGKLTALLVGKSGMSKQKVEEQLDELIQEVRDATDAGKDFIIDGFGTFTQQNDAPHFEADEVFQTEINHKYAGMKPIEIMGSFKESQLHIPPEITKQRIPPKESIKPEKQGKSTRPAASAVVSQKNLSKFSNRKTSKVGANRPEKKENAALSKNEEPSAENTRKSTKQNTTGTTGIFLIAIAIIIAILLAGWLFYDMGLLVNENTNNSSSATESAVSSYKPQNENKIREVVMLSHNNRSRTESVEVNESASVNKDPASTNTINSLYGLKGALNAKAMDGYTIVIHSLRNETLALDTKSSIQEQDYRVIMMKEAVNGQSQWRVGLGQFKTIRDAQNAAQTLPSPYKNNHFITRM